MKTISYRPLLVFIVILFIEICLALSPFIPSLNNIVRASLHTSDPFNIQISLTGIYAILITLFFGAGYWAVQAYLAEIIAKVEGMLQEHPSITFRRDDEFHQEFLLACQQAKNQVFITNLSPSPIYFSSSKDRNQYLASLLKEIKAKPKVQFRRLIRYTSENTKFATELISKLQGCSNAHLALIKDSDEEANPLALSVQVIDSNDCWLVALEAHERQTSYRDIHIRDKTFADAIYKYYMRLWQKGTIILESGIEKKDWKKELTRDEPKGLAL